MNRRRLFSWLLPPALLIAAVILLSFFSTPQGEPVREYFLSGGNFRYFAAQAAVVAAGALGMTLVMGAGAVDLSAGAVISLAGAAASALLRAGAPPGAAAIAALLVGAVAGAANGGVISLLRVAPFIVTLGTAGAFAALAQWLARNPAPLPHTWVSELLAPYPEEPIILLPPGLWLTFLLTGVVALVLRNTVFGCHLFAIGSNETAARLCGVQVALTRVLTFTFAGALYGFAGLLQAGRLHQTPPGMPWASAGLTLDLIAAAVLGGASLAGGTGNALGAVVAAFGITLLRNGTQQAGWPPYTQEFAAAAILIGAVALSRLRKVALEAAR